MTHMIQLAPDMPTCSRWFLDQNVVSKRGDDDMGYAWHALLAAAFDTDTPSAFKVMQKPNRGLRILGYSDKDADALKSIAATFAEPEVYKALGISDIASKPMPDDFVQGQRLGFELRTRPTSRVTVDGRETEKDVFLRAIDREPERMDHDRNTVYAEWFSRHMSEAGITLEMCSIEALRRTRVLRRDRSDGGSRLKPVEGPDVTFSGVLSILDPTRFRKTLGNGFGRHRSFGFGMLLLSPPK